MSRFVGYSVSFEVIVEPYVDPDKEGLVKWILFDPSTCKVLAEGQSSSIWSASKNVQIAIGMDEYKKEVAA